MHADAAKVTLRATTHLVKWWGDPPPQYAGRDLRAADFDLSNPPPQLAELTAVESDMQGRTLSKRTLYERAQPPDASLIYRAAPPQEEDNGAH